MHGKAQDDDQERDVHDPSADPEQAGDHPHQEAEEHPYPHDRERSEFSSSGVG